MSKPTIEQLTYTDEQMTDFLLDLNCDIADGIIERIKNNPALTAQALPDGWAYLSVSLHTRPGMKWPECAFTVRISNGLDKTVSGDGLTFSEAERAAIKAAKDGAP